MTPDNGNQAYVFREGRSELDARLLRRELDDELRLVRGLIDPADMRRALVDAMVRAGELECGLSDAGAPAATSMERVSDAIASALVAIDGVRQGGSSVQKAHDAKIAIDCAVETLEAMSLSGSIRASPAEGFAYYGLHPLDFADLARRIPRTSERICVVGIRTIGATLSAMATAALISEGVHATRVTVRPESSPYDRKTTFAPAQSAWLTRERALGAAVMVVDEGPGLSGSSFLSVAEALVEAGFSPDRVDLLGSRHVDPQRLVAPNGAIRWSKFRSHVSSTRAPPAGDFIGAGRWRALAYADQADWPPCWPMMERAKYRSGGELLKFEGLGRYGARVLSRASALAERGFCPPVHDVGDGYHAYAVLNGRPMDGTDVGFDLIARMAHYCAARIELLPADQTSELEPMVIKNLSLELPRQADPPRLEVVRPVIADSRMMPHEWIATANGIFKCDAATHGDDHFFPGPIDIAWDLAGAIVEWGLDIDQRTLLLETYERACGDRAARRVEAYELAYTVFRTGYTKMAAQNIEDPSERQRMMAGYARYRARLPDLLQSTFGVRRRMES
jgi:hypothetical protein